MRVCLLLSSCRFFLKEGEFSHTGNGLRDPDYAYFRQVSIFSPYSEARTIGKESYGLDEMGLLQFAVGSI